MFSFRRIRALVSSPSSLEDINAQLQNSSVPITDVDCRTCQEPCTDGHENYPARFNVDMESRMLGSVRPYRSQIVISTGVSDWDREVTHTSGSLAYYLSHVHVPRTGSPSSDSKKRMNGIFSSSDSNKLSILNGSHATISDDPHHETVLIFPDYKLVTGVVSSQEGAQNLWDHCLDPGRPENASLSSYPIEKTSLNTWIIPYSCVILLCSHKRRDNRCSIAAAKLEIEFTRSLQAQGWTVETQLDHPINSLGLPLEEFAGTPEELEAHALKQRQSLASEKKALIVKNSHIGGHRYAGNCIIYTPQGSGIWYGRVTPHDVDALVANTLEEGVILPQLLRGGINIARPGCRTLHDW